MNRDGAHLLGAAGEPETQAQPPFLLRYSPQLFAKECPTMFVHDAKTNALSLQPGRDPPWIRKASQEDRTYTRESTKTWLYCMDCKSRWCPDAEQRSKAFLPFRDRASQLNMRPHRHFEAEGALDNRSAGSSPIQPEPEPEGEAADAREGDVALPMEEEGDVCPPLPELVPDAPEPVARPTLAEYRARWGEKLATHSRLSFGPFSLANLVPRPIPNLWQDCRHLIAATEMSIVCVRWHPWRLDRVEAI